MTGNHARELLPNVNGAVCWKPRETYKGISAVDKPTFVKGTFQYPTLPNIKAIAGKNEFHSSINLPKKKGQIQQVSIKTQSWRTETLRE